MSPDKINVWLNDNFGYTVDGKALFRVVWTTGLTEKRFGEFEEYSESGDIYLRTVKGVKEVLKYPWCQNRYAVEKIQLLPENSELVGKFSYEPMYIFQNKKGQSLPLDRDIVQLVIMTYLNSINLNKQKFDSIDEYNKKESKEKIRQLIGENLSTPHLMDLVY